MKRDLPLRAALAALGVLVAASAVWRGLAARGVKAPWVMPDELIYSSLARSIASSGHVAIRGVRETGYSVLYPLLEAPAFSSGSAYAAAKWENAVLMSLAAVPLFFLARRLLPNVLALLAVVLALLIPSLAYTGELLTENAFYPLFLLALLAIVRTLENPTVLRQLAGLGAIAAAYLARAEGIVLVAVLFVAALLFALREPSPRRELRRYLPSMAVLAAAAAAVALVEAARGSSPAAFLGTYAASVRGYPLVHVPRWAAAHLADLELYVGFLPFVPAVVITWTLLTSERVDRSRRAVAAAAAAAVVCLLVLVALFSAGPGEQASKVATYPKLPPVLHERYLFYVVPLLLVLFLAWLHRRPRLRLPVFAALLALAALLPLTLPYARVRTNADFEALALLPWNNSLVAPRNVPVVLCVTAAILLPLLFVRRGSIVMLQVGLVAVVLVFEGIIAGDEMRKASRQLPTSRLDAPAWVDAAVPRAAKVAVLWRREPRWRLPATIAHEHALWRAEFFNSSIDGYWFLGSPMHYGLPETRARLVRGRLVLPGGQGIRYLLSASPPPVRAAAIARDPKAGLTLYRLPPLQP